MHGYGIAMKLKETSEEVLQVGESSLYPALQRLMLERLAGGGMGRVGEQPPGAFYTLDRGRPERLASERDDFDRMVAAIQKVLQTA